MVDRSSPVSALADELQKLCCAETEGKFFDCVTDNIGTIIKTLRAVGLAQCQQEPVAYRWRQPGNKHWIYDPTPEWIDDHKHEIELEPLFTNDAQPPQDDIKDFWHRTAVTLQEENKHLREAAQGSADYWQGMYTDLLKRVDQWRPIEAAPRDGTRILATGGGLDGAIEIVDYNERVGAWNTPNYTLDDRDNEAEGYNRPTLWQPLPVLADSSTEGK